MVFFVEQVRGVEPPYSAWEADVLPMNYTCVRHDYSITTGKNQVDFCPLQAASESSIGLWLIRRHALPFYLLV